MSLSELARFFRATGRPAEVEGGALWVAETRLSLMAVPGTRVIRPPLPGVHSVLRRTGRIAALYPSAGPTGVDVDQFVLRDRNYSMDSLQRQFRQQTRAALRECRVRPMAWAELGHLGLPANRDNLARQGKSNRFLTTPGRWAEVCDVAATVSGLEVMGCFTHAGDLAAYMITWTHERWCFGLQHCWVNVHRSLHPNHALYVVTATERMQRGDIDVFTVGRQTIPRMNRVDTFKDHAGFTRERCPVGVILHPWWRPFLSNPMVVRLLRGLRSLGRAPGALRNVEVLEAALAMQNVPTANLS